MFEEQSITLTEELAVDVGAPGYFRNGSAVTEGAVPSGTEVRSVLIHFDPVGAADTSLCCAPLADEALSEHDAGELAGLLKALADPVRLRLVREL